jgi:ankyrin repeat protein
MSDYAHILDEAQLGANIFAVLLSATNGNYVEIVRYILDTYGDLHYLRDVLVAGAQQNHWQIVQAILEFYPDLEIRDAMTIACEDGNLETVQILFEHGIELPEYFSDACYSGSLHLVQFFLAKSDVDIEEGLVMAAHRGHLNIVKYLLKLNPSLNVIPAFVDACGTGQVEVAQYLIQYYPIGIGSRNSAFLAAAQKNDLDIIRFLLDLGVSSVFINGVRHSAIVQDDKEKIELLRQFDSRKK